MNGGMDFAGMIGRMVRAAMLDAQVFEEVEHDPTKDQEALAAVILVALVNGILSFPFTLWHHGFGGAVVALVYGVVWTILGYYFYAYLAYYIGTSFFQGQADSGELRRVLGYAYAPAIFSWIPCIGFLIAGVWTFVASVVAIRQALDVDTNKALVTALIAVVIVFVVAAILSRLLAVG